MEEKVFFFFSFPSTEAICWNYNGTIYYMVADWIKRGGVKRCKGKLQNFTLTRSCHCTHNQPLRFYLWNLQLVQGWSSKDQTSWFYHFQARWIDLPYFSYKFFICEMGIRLQAILTRLWATLLKHLNSKSLYLFF